MTLPKKTQRCPHQIGALCLSFVFLLGIGCGGGSSSTGGSGGGTPPSANAMEWTWVGGSDTAVTVPSVYGTKGVAAPGNNPNGGGVSWVTSSGDLWLFGGGEVSLPGTIESENNLWEYSPASSEWTWVSGCGPTTCSQSGIYGTQGTPSVNNLPGGRGAAVSWIDDSGNFWLFGGQGYDSTGQGYDNLNDLWEYAPATKQWTWIDGSDLIMGKANYGTLGVAAPTNMPGARSNAVSWKDGNGNFWFFGGQGIDGNGVFGSFNDLWEFSPSGKEWTWVSGGTTVNTSGIYGTLGVASGTDVPGGRVNSVSWVDRSGNLWLFGGLGYDSTGSENDLNDLWEFSTSSKQWTWISGSSAVTGGPGTCVAGVYGTQGTAAAANMPGGRNAANSWIDASGNLWLFGGLGCDAHGTAGSLNDLWEFNTSSKTWTWQSGSNSVGAAQGGTGGPSGTYGTQGTASASGTPGGRSGSVSWVDSKGNLWLYGGSGHDATGHYGVLNDLWSYTP
jgi:N-acetylneuraminic acid mutarotase